MKFIVLLLALTCFKVNALVHAQQITLNVKDMPLIKVLDQIEKQSGFQFFYDNKIFSNPTSTITIKVKNVDINTALKKCFTGQPFSYQIIDKTIVVKPKPGLLERIGNYLKDIMVSGQVTDANGQPIAGVTVGLKNGKTFAITSTEGKYNINVPENAILVFSYIGYVTQEIPVNNITTHNVSLKEAVGLLDEQVIRGYGTTTQRLRTGNISVVKGETIANQPVTNPLQALIGRVSGLMITQGNGLPGSSVDVQIRGRNSITQSSTSNIPLYIVDGVPFPSETGLIRPSTFSSAMPINSISPNDIESISILKDADATAIYGSRGANGVILITTKKAQAGKSKFDFNMSNGYGSLTRTAKPLTTTQYLQMRRDAFANSGTTPTVSTAPDLLSWDTNTDNNLQEWYIGNTSEHWDSSASLSGGNSQTNFLISGNYHHENTIFSENDQYRRGNLRFNLGHTSSNRKLKVNLTSFYSNDFTKIQNSTLNSLINIAAFIPNYPLFDANGNYNWLANLNNPLALATSYWKNNTGNLNTNLLIDYDIIPGWQIKSSFGYNNMTYKAALPNPSKSYNPSNGTLGNTNFASANREAWIIEPQTTFSKRISKGIFDFLLGATIQQINSSASQVNVINYIDEQLLESQAGGSVSTATSSKSEYNFLSFFARSSYNWENKYILNGTFRRDGSSRFGPGRQFGNFASIGGAWLFANENIIKDNVKWLTYGKLRASYGSTGSDGIGDYGYLSLYGNPLDYGSSRSIRPSQIANSEYQWEINNKLELALEAGFFKDNILLSAVYYLNRSNNQLVTYPLPSTTGFSGYTANLPALVENSGWEFELNTTNLAKKNITWSTSFNLTIPKNRLVDFPNIELTSYANTLIIGQSLNTVLRFNFLGIDPATGLTLVEDVNKNGIFTNRSSYNNQGGDYVNVGNTDPKWYAGLNNSIRFKGFQLDIFFQYTKRKNFNLFTDANGAASFGRLRNTWTDYLDYWKQPGDQTTIPKPSAVANASVSLFSISSAAFSDASYLRLRNVAFSYKFSPSFSNKLGLNALRLFAQGQNLLTITDYIGYDPENASSNASIPPLKMFTFGLQVTL